MSILRGWKEITRYTGLSRGSILELRKQSKFPIRKIAGQYMTTEKAVEKFVEDSIIKPLST
jgi:hypothetical protein